MARLVLTVRTKTGETFVGTSESELDPEIDAVTNTMFLLTQSRHVGFLRVGSVADWAGEIIVAMDNIAFVAVSVTP